MRLRIFATLLISGATAANAAKLLIDHSTIDPAKSRAFATEQIAQQLSKKGIGVADMRHGDGTYLTNLQPDSLMRSVGLVLAMSDSGLEELFEAHKLVEPGLAKLAAQRMVG